MEVKTSLMEGVVYECLKEHYLSKRPPYALQELKFLDVKCEEQPVVYKLLKYLHTDLKLQTLSLYMIDLDSRSADIFCEGSEEKSALFEGA